MKYDLKAEKNLSGGKQSTYWRKIMKLLPSSPLPNSLPSSNTDKTTLGIPILQSCRMYLLNAMVELHDLLIMHVSLSVLPHLNKLPFFKEQLWCFYNTFIYSDGLDTKNKCNIEICYGLKCCLLAMSDY